jgi:hypothetical protein
MRFSSAGIDPRPTELLALRDRTLKTSVDALTDHAALKLGKSAADLVSEVAPDNTRGKHDLRPPTAPRSRVPSNSKPDRLRFRSGTAT